MDYRQQDHGSAESERPCDVCGSDTHSTLGHQLMPGDRIWVGTALYMSHGEDDFIGGMATVREATPGMSAGVMVPFVSIVERPGTSYNWEILAEKQAELRERFGDSPAYADPDDSPESNEWAGPGDFVSTTTFDRNGNPQLSSRVLGPDEHIA